MDTIEQGASPQLTQKETYNQKRNNRDLGTKPVINVIFRRSNFSDEEGLHIGSVDDPLTPKRQRRESIIFSDRDLPTYRGVPMGTLL